jgi:hypothetical protein
MKHRLTEAQWLEAVQQLGVGDRTRQISHDVLVHGRAQKELAEQYGLTPGAVSQAVQRVFRAYAERDLPAGLDRLKDRLTPHQLFQVKRWLKASTKRTGTP